MFLDLKAKQRVGLIVFFKRQIFMLFFCASVCVLSTPLFCIIQCICFRIIVSMDLNCVVIENEKKASSCPCF